MHGSNVENAGYEAQRKKVAALVYRIMNSCWRGDIDDYRTLHFPALRDAISGISAMDANLLRVVCEELSHLYDRQADRSSDDESGQIFADEITETGLDQMMQSVQRNTLAAGEMFIRPRLSEKGWVFRQVWPHMVTALADPEMPSQPVMVREERPRPINGRMMTTYDEVSVADPMHPYYRIVLADGNAETDITAKYFKTIPKDGDYPFRYSDGTPFIPYQIYHKQELYKLWTGPTDEIIEGTLGTAVNWTFWQHCLKDNSWPQRWIAGGHISGTRTTGEGNTVKAEVAVDPSIVVQIKSDVEGSPQVGQWQPASDPKGLGEAIYYNECRLLKYYHLTPADTERTTAESGFALSLKSSAVREEQRRYAPLFRRADQQLMGMCAAIANRQNGTSIPEGGYKVTYKQIPLTPQERKDARDDMIERMAQGVASAVDLYLLDHPGETRQDAIKAIADIRRESQIISLTAGGQDV